MANIEDETGKKVPDYCLDITGEVCPLTFVRTKLLIERMSPGEIALVMLRGREPLANVPRAVAGQGHEILELAPISESGDDAVHRLRFRKKQLTGHDA
jgi:TusA-related sulfurtransferase